MTQIGFYHLTASPFERALPKLLEKCYTNQYRTLLVAANDQEAETLDKLLWTYAQLSFLPHGLSTDAHADLQPVLITTDMSQNKNNANLLFITTGAAPEQPEGYERIIDLFDGKDEAAVTHARARWKAYKDAGHDLTYFRQKDDGGWEKAA